jgi:GMC oxidoreductase
MTEVISAKPQQASVSDDRRGSGRRAILGAALGAGVSMSGVAPRTAVASSVAVLTSPEELRPVYDHVIIGAGSARCVLANRLGRAGRRVLIIEAGTMGTLPAIANPPDWPELQGSPVDWCYETTPQPGLEGRVVTCPRGKVVGGSSTINALAYQRGHRAAYDRWPEGWRYADLLPCFKRAETFSGGADAWHGGDGPLHVLSLAGVADRTPIAGAFIEAAQERGFPYAPDIGGATPTGVGWNQLSVRHGCGTTEQRRISAGSKVPPSISLSARGSWGWPWSADAVSACGCVTAPCGPTAMCCSAPVPSIHRGC